MRKLIYSINLTIDGCCDHTKMRGSDDILEYFAKLLQGAGMLVYGRKTYDLMVPYWPDIARNHSGDSKEETEFAETFDSLDKLVFSKTMGDTDEVRTRIVRTDPREEILRLKQQQGGHMLLGGVDLASQLIGLGLVDEYYFGIHPIIAGEGRRLMEGINLQESLKLKLVESMTLKSGCVMLHFVK